MLPTTSPTEILDQLDPWGFGASGGDDQSAVIARYEPIDEPVDDDEPFLDALPELAAVAAGVPAASAFPMPLPAADSTQGLGLPFPRHMAAVLALFGAVIVAQGFYIGFSLTGEASARPDVGEVVVSSHPTGAQVRVDGDMHGTTPLVLPLVAGRHRVELVGASGDPTFLEADVVAGERWTRHVVLAPAAVETPQAGALRVDTGRTPAQVLIDGEPAGAAPVTRANLAAGAHAVRVEFRNGTSIERTVTVPASETLSLVLDAPATRPVAPAAPASGWLRVDAPFEVQVFRAGDLVGSSLSERIMLPAGGHDLVLVSAALGYRATVKANVVTGKLVPLVIDTPRVPVAVNAQPWAELIVDGRVHGDTPLANVMLPIGVHDIVLRHPELGERRQTVTVRASGANRVSADLRR